MEVWKRSYTVEVSWVVLSRLFASSTIKDSYTMEAWRSSYIVGVWKRFLHCGSVEGCTHLVVCIKYHKIFLCRGSMYSFYIVEVWQRFLHRGSVEGCIKLVVVHQVP